MPLDFMIMQRPIQVISLFLGDGEKDPVDHLLEPRHGQADLLVELGVRHLRIIFLRQAEDLELAVCRR